MGEIDTKRIESVQSQISIFGQKSEWRKFRSTSIGVRSLQDAEKEKELGFLLKELASYKVQLEIEESANHQFLLELEICRKTISEMSSQLKKSEAAREQYIKDLEESKTSMDKLESENNEISSRLLENEKAREQLMSDINDLKATQELLRAELAAAEESKQAAQRQSSLVETAVNMEKEMNEELLKHVSELNETILLSKQAANESEEDKSTIMLQEEMQVAASEMMQAHEDLEEMRKQLDAAKDLENQLMNKSLLINSLRSELALVKESSIDAVNNLNRLKLEMETMELANSEHVMYIESMETELKQSQEELLNAREDIACLEQQIELIQVEMQKAEEKATGFKEREREAQVEIALLKSEIHKAKAKVAAAEAAEARANSIKLGFQLAVQNLAVEAEEAKKEKLRLEQTAVYASGVADSTCPISELGSSMVEEMGTNNTNANPTSAEFSSGITISLEKYDPLVQKSVEADKVKHSPTQDNSHLSESGNAYELEILKKEVEAANIEIRDLRCIANQAVERASRAESAKAAIEDQLRKWREHRQRKKLALAAHREESNLKHHNPPKGANSSVYLPLGKVLNMRF